MSDTSSAERATTGTFDGRSEARNSASQEQNDVTTWPHLAEGLYSFLTGRGATIEYTFDNIEVWVPRDTAPNSPSAHWKVNGCLRVRTYEPGTEGRR